MRKFITKIREKAEGAAIALTTKAKALKNDISGNEPSGFVGLILVTLLIVALLIVGMRAFFPGLLENLFGHANDLTGEIADAAAETMVFPA